MKRKRLTSDVKARIPVEMKKDVDRLADEALVSSSDIIRKALALLISKTPKRKTKEAA